MAGSQNLYCENTSMGLFVITVPVSSRRYFALPARRCMALLAAMLWVLILCPSSQTIMSGRHSANSFSMRHADS